MPVPLLSSQSKEKKQSRQESWCTETKKAVQEMGLGARVRRWLRFPESLQSGASSWWSVAVSGGGSPASLFGPFGVKGSGSSASSETPQLPSCCLSFPVTVALLKQGAGLQAEVNWECTLFFLPWHLCLMLVLGSREGTTPWAPPCIWLFTWPDSLKRLAMW